MPDFVEIAVVFALYLSILLGRDDNVIMFGLAAD